MKKLMYLTVTAPCGRQEAFLIAEVNCLLEKGVDLTIVPVHPSGPVFHRDGVDLLARTVVAGLWSGEVWLAALLWFFKAPRRVLSLLFLLLKGGSPVNKAKNLLVFPKSLFIAGKVKSLGIDHIHAHWASTPSTCALVASALTGVPWSFTAHRWDIMVNNLLAEKVGRCSFVRVVSTWGLRQVSRIAGSEAAKKVLYCPMGVKRPGKIPEVSCTLRREFFIAAVGNLTPLKGHRYLLQACRLLADWGVKFRCLIIGDGPERKNLAELAASLGLNNTAWLTGAMPHHRVLRMFRTGAFRVLVHPSVETPDGQHEGVPVAVMEAMAHGVPVVVTDTGSTTDLVDGRCGLVVPQKDPVALATAVKALLDDPGRARSLAAAGCRKIDGLFSLDRNVNILLTRMGITP
ncbi:MAG: glycosyltransferase family 4 protein [Pelotomaculum sp.]|uniref:Glycosyltransferase n=1 Tax=Pelotomaculum thermopropionicum (strain DSM 13744 / JCM 10971 / SI) TaxID=370438 RepID=A5D387_PELTS|nr:glycosyltransferase family 4 protein [Pelotomaculum sp.]BAF59288.1 glycosyltransferase [Pelotomaculum thermopropionicum SI]